VTFPGFSGALSILDTTLRDGDQSPGFAFSPREKLELALLLDEIGVDAIEAGFPTSSPVDFEACRLVASAGLRARIAVMTRCRLDDIEKTSRVFPRFLPRASRVIHLSLPVSERHMRGKLGKGPDEIIRLAEECVRFASGFAGLVELGAEDATRADKSFLADYCAAAVAAGATHVNVADTVGVANPDGFAALIRFLVASVPEFGDRRATLSVHCHDDLGLATANTLAAIRAGATQAETTIAGIGERAGNACFEEIVANLLYAGGETVANETVADEAAGARDSPLSRLDGLSRALSAMRSVDFSRGRPAIGKSCRNHCSGIHQSGLLMDPALYNPVAAKLSERGAIAPGERIVLSRHSGSAGLAHAIEACTGRKPPESVVSSTLGRIKAGESDAHLIGATELLSLLADESFVADRPLRCLSAHETRSDGGYAVRAVIGRAAADGVQACGRGDTALAAALAAVGEISAVTITVRTVSASLYAEGRDARADRFRVALDALVDRNPACPYAVERIGDGLGRVILECLLDIVNSELEISKGR